MRLKKQTKTLVNDLKQLTQMIDLKALFLLQERRNAASNSKETALQKQTSLTTMTPTSEAYQPSSLDQLLNLKFLSRRKKDSLL